ncbi:hypothetical protein AXF42_Ash000078 [Apostasia shenzhenica]|uniref:RRM domain-containing protein n=1 Tax=Apostasia shenzhenica TaxID=1088818 RepID=A0A2I0AFE9_9ASPA|nr:hypothetical protein AXF42_Ash000078 [Apostasia shenzhenica]
MESSHVFFIGLLVLPRRQCCRAAKLFLGGITKELPEDVLKEYFSAYGEVKDVVVTGIVDWKRERLLVFSNSLMPKRLRGLSAKRSSISINNKSLSLDIYAKGGSDNKPRSSLEYHGPIANINTKKGLNTKPPRSASAMYVLP